MALHALQIPLGGLGPRTRGGADGGCCPLGLAVDVSSQPRMAGRDGCPDPRSAPCQLPASGRTGRTGWSLSQGLPLGAGGLPLPLRTRVPLANHLVRYPSRVGFRAAAVQHSAGSSSSPPSHASTGVRGASPPRAGTPSAHRANASAVSTLAAPLLEEQMGAPCDDAGGEGEGNRATEPPPPDSLASRADGQEDISEGRSGLDKERQGDGEEVGSARVYPEASSSQSRQADSSKSLSSPAPWKGKAVAGRRNDRWSLQVQQQELGSEGVEHRAQEKRWNEKGLKGDTQGGGRRASKWSAKLDQWSRTSQAPNVSKVSRFPRLSKARSPKTAGDVESEVRQRLRKLQEDWDRDMAARSLRISSSRAQAEPSAWAGEGAEDGPEPGAGAEAGAEEGSGRDDTATDSTGGTCAGEGSTSPGGSGRSQGVNLTGVYQGYPMGAEGILSQVLGGMVEQQLRRLEGAVHSGMCARILRSLRSLPLALAFFRWATCQPGFRPSPQCYAVLLKHCGTARLFRTAGHEESQRALQWAVGDAQRRGVPWTTHMLAAAVQSYGTLGRISDADALVSDAAKGGLVLDWQILWGMVHWHMREGRVAAAKPYARSLRTLLAECKSGNPFAVAGGRQSIPGTPQADPSQPPREEQQEPAKGEEEGAPGTGRGLSKDALGDRVWQRRGPGAGGPVLAEAGAATGDDNGQRHVGKREQQRLPWEQRVVLKMGAQGVTALVEYYASIGRPHEILRVLEEATEAVRCIHALLAEAQAELVVHRRHVPSSAGLGTKQGERERREEREEQNEGEGEREGEGEGGAERSGGDEDLWGTLGLRVNGRLVSLVGLCVPEQGQGQGQGSTTAATAAPLTAAAGARRLNLVPGLGLLSPDTFHTAVCALLEANDIPRAEKALRLMSEASAASERIAAPEYMVPQAWGGLERPAAGSGQAVAEGMGQGQPLGLQPRAATLEALMQAYSDARREQDALATFDFMRHAKMPLSVRAYNVALGIHCRALDMASARQLLLEMSIPTTREAPPSTQPSHSQHGSPHSPFGTELEPVLPQENRSDTEFSVPLPGTPGASPDEQWERVGDAGHGADAGAEWEWVGGTAERAVTGAGWERVGTASLGAPSVRATQGGGTGEEGLGRPSITGRGEGSRGAPSRASSGEEGEGTPRVSPNAATFTILLSMYARRQQHKDVLAVFEKIRPSGLHPVTTHYNIYMGALGALGRTEEVMATFLSIAKGEVSGCAVDAPLVGAFMNLMVEAGDPAMACHAAAMSASWGVPMDRHMCNILLKLFLRLGNEAAAEQLLQDMLTRGRLGEVSWDNLQAVAAPHTTPAAEFVILEGRTAAQEAAESTQGATDAGLGKAGATQEAARASLEGLLERGGEQGLCTPDLVTWGTMFQHYHSKSDRTKVIEAYYQLMGDGMTPDGRILCLVLEAAVGLRDRVLVRDVMTTTVALGLFSRKHCAREWTRWRGLWEAGKRLLGPTADF